MSLKKTKSGKPCTYGFPLLDFFFKIHEDKVGCIINERKYDCRIITI